MLVYSSLGMARIYLTGENQLTLESLKNFLKKKGYEVLHDKIVECIRKEKIFEIKPDIIFWDSDIIESRESVVFDFIGHSKYSFKSIFVISSRSFPVLGMGLVNGVQGFIHKSGGVQELQNCIDALDMGEKYISPFLAGAFNSNGYNKGKQRRASTRLTQQEKKILKLVDSKKTSKEIADVLNISYKTVQNHRHNICQKLGLRGRGSLVKFANLYYDQA